MILLKFNWGSKAPLPEGGRFNFGDTYKVAEMVLSKGKSTKACTMEALAEHESKISQLQLVCNATAIQVEVCQTTKGDNFKWLAQVRGTPMPNNPQMFYYRTPEEFATQKLWRLRLKFLFASVEGSTVVRIQNMDVCFDNLTRRTLSRSGSQLSLSRSGSQHSMSRSASQLSLMSTGADSKTDNLLKKVTAELKSEGTASCSTATPTGSRTPTSDADVSDLGSISSAPDKSEAFNSTGGVSTISQEGGHFETKKTSPVHRNDSSSSLDSSLSTSSRRRSRREAGSQQKVMAEFVAVVDGVITSLTAKAEKDQDPFLIQELIMLRDRVQVHANQESLDNLDLSADVAKLNSLLTSRLPGP